jgi:hypothetical protein
MSELNFTEKTRSIKLAVLPAAGVATVVGVSSLIASAFMLPGGARVLQALAAIGFGFSLIYLAKTVIQNVVYARILEAAAVEYEETGAIEGFTPSAEIHEKTFDFESLETKKTDRPPRPATKFENGKILLRLLLLDFNTAWQPVQLSFSVRLTLYLFLTETGLFILQQPQVWTTQQVIQSTAVFSAISTAATYFFVILHGTGVSRKYFRSEFPVADNDLCDIAQALSRTPFPRRSKWLYNSLPEETLVVVLVGSIFCLGLAQLKFAVGL